MAWIGAAAVLVWLALWSFPAPLPHPVPAALAFTPWVVAVSWVPALLAFVLRRHRAAVVATIAALALVAVQLPRHTPSTDPSVGSERPAVRVLAANLQYGEADADVVVEHVRDDDIDIFVAVELTPDAVEALDEAGLGDLLTHRHLLHEPGAGGGGIYSRWPLSGVGDLTAELPPAVPRMPRAQVAVPGAVEVEVVAVHPQPPIGQAATERWRQYFDLLPRPQAGTSTILAGDFNATLDHVELRGLLDAGYLDAAAETGGGGKPTWPSGTRAIPGIAIDHILVDEATTPTSFDTRDLPGSDHRGVLAELEVPRAEG